MRTGHQLPLASAEQEADAMERVGPAWQSMPPDEWVARNIHRFPLWGWADYRFPTRAFDDWIREAERYVFDVKGRRALRARYLTDDEIDAAEAHENEPL